MTVFSSVVASVSPEVFAGRSRADAESVLSHLAATCYVTCSVTPDGTYQIQGSWAAIQDVYILLCAHTGEFNVKFAGCFSRDLFW